MESKAKLLGHSVHAMLIAFPVGLLVTAVIFDIIHLVTKNGQWASISFYLIAAGIIGGLAAALFGFIDYLAIPAGTRAKGVGRTHGLGNVAVVVLFLLSWWMRRPSPEAPPGSALLFSFLGVALASVTAWLGGELVERLGVAVHDGANLDAPSSLSGQRASTTTHSPGRVDNTRA
ncbi:MAG: DUF2231 domain-containing protein [Gemmatimonadaceae bacterium]